ncbi:VanZ family protein [Teredinibacter haidensis]|uniref:VanZ family protein n=1 Tax=Teredinibacter haidensis TaxID=2731755 RepID=UPI0009FAAB39|nr:VanZ family protein [Teredinibacter haidensis]
MSASLEPEVRCLNNRFSWRLFLGFFLLLVVIGLNSWLLFYYKLPGKNFFWSALHNSGHDLVFLGLAFLLSLILHYFVVNRKLTRAAAYSLVLSLVFGAAVELLQAQVGREASWDDFRLDAAGSLAGVCVYLAIYWCHWRRYVAIVLCILLLGISLIEPIKWRLAEEYREDAFPVLADFDNDWLNLYVRPAYQASLSFVAAPAKWKGNNTVVAKLALRPAPWPGLHLAEVERDWRGYKTFSFEVFNPQSEPVKLVTRVHDRSHNNKHNDRFNRTYTLAPGYQKIEIPIAKIMSAPKGRDMRMDRVRAVMFYSYKLQEEQILYFDNIRLF